MRTATYVIIAVVFLAAIGAVIWFISGSSRSGFDIYTCEEDPYRREVLIELKRVLMDETLVDWDDIRVHSLPRGSTSDDISPPERTPRCIFCLLPPGRRPLAGDFPTVLGPVASHMKQRAESIASNASVLVADTPEFLLKADLASAFGISDKRISIAAAGAATGLFEGERLLETDPDGRFIAALGQNSALRVLCDGAKLETVRKWANIAVENDVALVVDRRGYLVPNALAMSTVDPSAVASSLLRLALRRMNFPSAEMEMREASLFLKLYRPAVAKKLGLTPSADNPFLAYSP